MKSFTGVGVALVTPFDAQKKIDYTALQKLIENCIEGGVDFLVTMGTTGETATLHESEKEELLEKTIEYNQARVPIVMGIGGNNTEAVKSDILKFQERGIDGILSVCPYYNKPSQEGLYQHFTVLAKASKLPIILYNVPGRTASSIDSETVLRLARENENIVAIKEASADMASITRMIAGAPEEFVVLSGDDDLVLAQTSIGVQGVISVAANAFPQIFCNMINTAIQGDKMETPRSYYYEMVEAIWALFAEGNPAGVKQVLAQKGICQNELRLPLVPVSPALADRLQSLTQDLS